MNIEKLAPYAMTLALLASTTHSLPYAINTVRKAEFSLIQQSKASTWLKAPMLHKFKRPF